MFHLCASPEPASQDIIKQSGYLITPEDFQELLEEAARYLDIPQKNGSSASLENHEKKTHPLENERLLHLKITLLWKGKSSEANLHDFGGKP